jgi:hypothetical protein
MWLLVLALVGCGDGGSEVGSAQTVSVMEEVVSCGEAENGIAISGIGQTVYTVEACNEAFCQNIASDINGSAYLESVSRVIDEASSGGAAVDTVYVQCDSAATEVRIRWLAIEQSE